MSHIHDKVRYVVEALPEFDAWFAGLRDTIGRRAILARLVRLESGLFGDVKAIGGGVSELRIDVGPGYRVYFVRSGATVIVLLCGGDKNSQRRDVDRAMHFAAQVRIKE